MSEKNPLSPQTYIIAQNPEVLARLMMENENRSINPAAYTTPASVFNTLAVEIDETKTTKVPNSTDVPLKMTKLPASELFKLDPIADEQNVSTLTRLGGTSKQTTLAKSTTNTNETQPLSLPLHCSCLDKTKHSTNCVYLNTGNAVEPNTTTVYLKNSRQDIQNNFCTIPTNIHCQKPQMQNNFVLYNPQANIYDFQRMPVDPKITKSDLLRRCNPHSYGSLERNQDTYIIGAIKPLPSKGGSLERNQSISISNNFMRDWVHRSSSLERATTLDAYAGNQTIKTNLSNSLERNISYRTYRNQMKSSMEAEPLQEEIYDFGGSNVKSCATSSLNRNRTADIIPRMQSQRDLAGNCKSQAIAQPFDPKVSPNSTYTPMAPGGKSLTTSYGISKDFNMHTMQQYPYPINENSELEASNYTDNLHLVQLNAQSAGISQDGVHIAECSLGAQV